MAGHRARRPVSEEGSAEPRSAGKATRGRYGAGPDRIAAVMARAAESGLTRDKAGRISGRVSPDLIERAKARTGLRSDTDLVAFALANIAVEDEFAQVFRDLKGSVDPDLDLGV
jgi:hypothetical protein